MYLTLDDCILLMQYVKNLCVHVHVQVALFLNCD